MSPTTTRPPLKLVPNPLLETSPITSDGAVATTGQSAAAAGPAPSLVQKILDEKPIGMAAAAALVGSFRRGRPTHCATVTRWCAKGVKRADGRVVRLESVRVGGRMVTSKAAVVRFLEAQQREPAAAPPQSDTGQLSPAPGRRAAEVASKALDAALGKR
ncbi:MAG: DUF1580 domain-containing protein [Gemmataceae bacterium]|nr:DUF1580 domain-containing protein [Gemmataceae bacterium]